MTPSQKRARMRNWAKMLLSGIGTNTLIIADGYPVTKREYSSLMSIYEAVHELIFRWELNYEEAKKENPI